MCGIVYSKSFTGKPVNTTVIKRYLNQRSRGTDGFGFYIPERNRLTHNVRETRILSLLRRDKADEILFHHRFPTSTSNVRNACHPFSTKDYYDHNYVLVHNGVLHNEDTLQKRHVTEGIKYVSMQESGRFNDSEALAHDVAQYIEGKVDTITARGSIAFICVQNDKDGKAQALYFGRNSGNPLKMKWTKHSLTISSEGKGEDVPTNRLYRYDYKTKDLSFTNVIIPVGVSKTTYYGSYTGYSSGYAWEDDDRLDDFSYSFGYDRYGNKIDHNGHIVSSTQDYFLRTGDTTLYNEEEQAERSFVKDCVARLKYDTFEDAAAAIELAEDELFALEKRERYLESKELADTITDKELTEYCDIADQIELLKRAVEMLSQEVVGKPQMGFRILPASTKNKGGATC